MKKVFIDGSAGTTGLRIHERLKDRDDISVITLNEEMRKDNAARREAFCEADIAFLCLPDAAAREAAEFAPDDTVILDTSSAHRTAQGWTYGFPEIDKNRREEIAKSKRISVPGCHAGGFIALVSPLVKAGIIPSDLPLFCFSITGYSGGGKKMIAEYESSENELLFAPRQYGIGQNHKHLPEMKAACSLDVTPVFCPVVSDFYSGMEVTVPLFASQIKGNADDIKAVYKNAYNGPVVFYGEDDEEGFLSAAKYSKTDKMTVGVSGNDERIILCARYDNLGKGASGAAIQCMNIVMGTDETRGLEL